MIRSEIIAYWVMVGLYTVATVTIFFGVLFKKRAWVDGSLAITAAGFVAELVTIGLRWQASGHFTYVSAYENILTGSAFIILGYLLVAWRWRQLSFIGALIMPVVLLTLGYGLTQSTPPGPVTPAYQSGWLVVHVTFANITYATYCVVAGLAVAQLVRLRAEKRGTAATGVPSWVPSSERIDDLSLKLVAFGFLNNAVMIASGSIWAYRLWGSYWSWDPVETWTLLTWLAYGFYMHARLTLGWKGARLAWVALFALFGVMMSFWGVQLFPTLLAAGTPSQHIFRNMAGQ